MLTTRIRPKASVKPLATTNSSPANVMPFIVTLTNWALSRIGLLHQAADADEDHECDRAARQEAADLAPNLGTANCGGPPASMAHRRSARPPSPLLHGGKHTTCVPSLAGGTILRGVGMQTTSDDLPRRVVDALGRGSRSDRTLRLADAFAAALDDEAAGVAAALAAHAGGRDRRPSQHRAGGARAARRHRRRRSPAGRPLRHAGARTAVVVVEPREPWPWVGAAVEPLLPRGTRRLPLAALDPPPPAWCWRPRSSWTTCAPGCRWPRCSASV